MNRILLGLTILVFFNVNAFGQDQGTFENLISVYFDAEGQSNVIVDQALDTMVDVYVVLTCPSVDSICGYDFYLNGLLDCGPFYLPPSASLVYDHNEPYVGYYYEIALSEPLELGAATVLMGASRWFTPYAGEYGGYDVLSLGSAHDENAPPNLLICDGSLIPADLLGEPGEAVAFVYSFDPVATEKCSWSNLKCLFK